MSVVIRLARAGTKKRPVYHVVVAWLAKGAQPSDRVSRFLDAAGVAKRAARSNPEKAVPRKERKAQAEAAAKTA